MLNSTSRMGAMYLVTLLIACTQRIPAAESPPAEARPKTIGLAGACTTTAACIDGLVCFRRACTRACAAHTHCTVGNERCIGGVCLVAPPACNDGVLDANEQCDDGNQADNDACTNDCRAAFCGDGIIRADISDLENPTAESCDDGNATDDANGCSAECKVNAICGDEVVQSLFETCDDGNLEDFDGCSAQCNRAIWSIPLNTQAADLPLTAWNFTDLRGQPVKAVAVAGANGALLIFNRTTGASLWQYNAGAPLVGPPVVVSTKRLAILSSDGVVHGLRPDGLSTPLWTLDLGDAGSALSAGGRPGRWIVSDGDGVLQSINISGGLDAWTTFRGIALTDANRTAPSACTGCAPIVPSGRASRIASVLMPHARGFWMLDLYDDDAPCSPYLFTLDAEERTVGLSFQGNSQAKAYDSADKAYVATNKGRIMQGQFTHTGACTGEILVDWTWTADGIPVAAPVVGDLSGVRTIIYATTAGKVVALQTTPEEPTPNTTLWEYDSGGPLKASPTLNADGGIYVVTTTGSLQAITPEGEPAWRYALQAPAVSSPMLIDGALYVVTSDGWLHALEAQALDAPPQWWSRQNANNKNSSYSSNCTQLGQPTLYWTFLCTMGLWLMRRVTRSPRSGRTTW